MKTILIGTAAALALAFVIYAATAPYQRFPGVIIGGEPAAAPADWREVDTEPVALLKLAGFPPFVIRVFISTDEGGIITATRPDGGYWAARLRSAADPHGWLRIGDSTYSLNAREILGAARIPYLESYGAKYDMPMGYDFEGEVIAGRNEPLHSWEVFYWTARR